MNFKIGFEQEDKTKLFSMWDHILTKHRWSEGEFVNQFEEKWAEYAGVVYAVAFSSWFGAAMAALEYFEVKGKTVLCPSNTFMATPLSVLRAGGKVEFVDCSRKDLCIGMTKGYTMSLDYFACQGEDIVAVFLVHIGGHIAFEVKEITDYCNKRSWILIEDCAHAHGASWNGRKAGTYGDCGVYSFYATKTISTGEGGMLVTNNQALYEFAKMYRNYGKGSYLIEGGNYRMSEFTAALGCVQTDRLDDIVAWKNEYAQNHLDRLFSDKLELPDGMISGLYKYIIFDEDYDGPTTGAVYDQPCHKIMKTKQYLLNTDWVAKHHKTIPLWYKGGKL